MNPSRILQLLLTAWVSLSLVGVAVELPQEPEIVCCCGDQCYMACARGSRGASHREPISPDGRVRPASACADRCPTQHLGQKVPGPQPSLAPTVAFETPVAGRSVRFAGALAPADHTRPAAVARGPPTALPSPS